MSKTYVISLGGSLVVPDEIDVKFLQRLKKVLYKYIENGSKFVLIVGGGKISRKYQDAANKVSKLTDDDKDWLGIHSTRLNAHLIRTIFRDKSYPVINKNPFTKDPIERHLDDSSILVAAGWKPGRSTDYIAVKLAERLDIKTIINLSNIKYVYNKDPKKFKDAKKLEKINWESFKKIVGEKWSPGLNLPFGPVASKLASSLNLEVIVANGDSLDNLNDILSGKNFIGTTIS